MQIIRKAVVRLLIAALLLSVSVIPASAAEAQPQPEAAVQFFDTDDGDVLYLRLDAAVSGVTESLSVCVETCDSDAQASRVYGADAIRVSLPDDVGAVELFIPDCWATPGDVMRIKGLAAADGTPIERQIRLEQETLQVCSYAGLEIPNPDLSLNINYYTGDVNLWKIESGVRKAERNAPYYCLAGEPVRFALNVPDVLLERSQLIEDGVQTEKIGDGEWKAVSGNGRLTMQIAQHVRYSAKLCVHADRKTQKSMILRTMLRRPWNPCIVWITGAMMLGSMPVPFLFPIMAVLGVVTLPLGYLAQFIAMAV